MLLSRLLEISAIKISYYYYIKKAADTDLVIVHWRQSKRGISMHHGKISQTHININTLHLQIQQKSFILVINNHLVFYMGCIFGLYNHRLKPISTSMSVGPQRISTPPYTPHYLRSSIETLIFTPLLPPPGRAHSRRRPRELSLIILVPINHNFFLTYKQRKPPIMRRIQRI